jgi:hypothetical protein
MAAKARNGIVVELKDSIPLRNFAVLFKFLCFLHFVVYTRDSNINSGCILRLISFVKIESLQHRPVVCILGQ